MLGRHRYGFAGEGRGEGRGRMGWWSGGRAAQAEGRAMTATTRPCPTDASWAGPPCPCLRTPPLSPPVAAGDGRSGQGSIHATTGCRSCMGTSWAGRDGRERAWRSRRSATRRAAHARRSELELGPELAQVGADERLLGQVGSVLRKAREGGGRDEHARESARERRSVVSERAPGGTYHRVEGPPERRPQVEALVDGLGLGRQPAGAGRRRGCAALVQRQGRQQVLGRLLEDADVEACRPTWGGGKPASVSACGRGDEGDEDGAPVTHTTRRGCRRPG